MFLLLLPGWLIRTSFPRVRGDVPVSLMLIAYATGFSPRARGCSAIFLLPAPRHPVFPACAGMFLVVEISRLGRPSFPRVRGDVPCGKNRRKSGRKFSPRARGCSWWCLRIVGGPGVFPACAGMFLVVPTHRWRPRCFPRVRGDVPTFVTWGAGNGRFSPRARGCSADYDPQYLNPDVFPACAGMFRASRTPSLMSFSFPRVRGDVPSTS